MPCYGPELLVSLGGSGPHGPRGSSPGSVVNGSGSCSKPCPAPYPHGTQRGLYSSSSPSYGPRDPQRSWGKPQLGTQDTSVLGWLGVPPMVTRAPHPARPSALGAPTIAAPMGSGQGAWEHRLLWVLSDEQLGAWAPLSTSVKDIPPEGQEGELTVQAVGGGCSLLGAVRSPEMDRFSCLPCVHLSAMSSGLPQPLPLLRSGWTLVTGGGQAKSCSCQRVAVSAGCR